VKSLWIKLTDTKNLHLAT